MQKKRVKGAGPKENGMGRDDWGGGGQAAAERRARKADGVELVWERDGPTMDGREMGNKMNKRDAGRTCLPCAVQ